MPMSSKQKLYVGAGVSLMAILALLGFAGEAHADTIPAPEPDDKKNPNDVVDELVSDTPVPGKFYQIRKGDNLTEIARAALKSVVPGNYGDAISYQKCISGSAWNRELYGFPDDFTNRFPKYTSPDNISIRSSFYPRHTDAITSILSLKMPQRGGLVRSGSSYTGGGGSSYALLWLPAVNAKTLAEYKEPQCGVQKWPDGTSAMEPPAVLFDLFEEG